MHKHWHSRSKLSKVAIILPLIVLVTVAVGFGVMYLWNWLMPALFGLKEIGYWQAIGLLVLGRLLFGSWRGGHMHGRHWRHRIAEHWADMTPEAREKLRAKMERHGIDVSKAWPPSGNTE